jgi:vancomycin resistance protein YoaR
MVLPFFLALVMTFTPGFGALTGLQVPMENQKAAAEGNFDPFLRGSLESRPVTSLPWDSDPEFLAAKEKSGCPLLMAAYMTVLRDPLPGEESNVHTAARYVAGTVLRPGEVFSQNAVAGPYTEDRGYRIGPTYVGTSYIETIGGGVCKIASTLYNVAVLSDFAIVERHNHGMPVPYVPYGQDATVAYGAKDIRFQNNSGAPVLLWAQGIGNILYIAAYGSVTPPKIVWHHDVIEVIEAPVLRKKNTALPPGTEKMTHEGMAGATVRSWITLFYPDGGSKLREMSPSFYSPLAYVIEYNP